MNEKTLPRRGFFRRDGRGGRVSVWLLAVCLAAGFCARHVLIPKLKHLYPKSTYVTAEVHESFSWTTITPSAKMAYHDCYESLQCARLLVPTNHDRPTENLDIALALIRRPAKVPITDGRYGGAILINPGGPGGSGIAQQLSMGANIQRVVDAETEPRWYSESARDADKYFDIIGFDPRGVNHSTPTVSCFPDNVSRLRWNLQLEAEGILGSSEMSLRSNWRRARALADGCSRTLSAADSNRLAEHVNTSPVAEDIAYMIEKHGEWREQEARKIRVEAHRGHILDPEQQALMLSRTAWRKGKEQLQYWGFSYGTLLGSTFAAMFPERVGRMVLDGVVDTDDYYSGTWQQNLADTDEVLSRFMLYCQKAGPEKCNFWRSGGPQAIEAAYKKLLTDIWDDPLSVPGTAHRGPQIITWTDLKLIVKDALYSPLWSFPIMADMMQDITHGNGSRFADYKAGNRDQACRSKQCEVDGPFSHDCILPGWSPYDALPAILCTDALGPWNFTEDDFRSYWDSLKHQSAALGDFWAQTRLSCAGWQARAVRRFPGPFSGNTSNPILFVGNTFDTVTPLQNAKKMAGRFPGSALLQQDSEGHCSFTNPSLCTGKTIRKYFQSGTLPREDTICAPDAQPFHGVRHPEKHDTVTDIALLRVLEDTSRSFRVVHPV